MGSLLVPVLVVIVVIAFIALLKIIANNYIKVPPNRVAIFYGRKHVGADGKTIGFRVVRGGAKFRFPIVESVTYLDLNVFSIDLSVQGAPNKDGVLVNVRGVANVKILSDDASLLAAAERFLGMSPDEIRDIAFKNLEGHLRAIIGRLTVEEIVSDRTKFNQEVLREACEDLQKIGLGVDVLTIQEIEDQYGYIKALGQKRTAEVVRDATVGKAQAERDAAIGKAEAERDAMIRATTAQREAQQKANENLALIAEAEKDRDVKKAQYLAMVQREQAIAAQEGPLAEAERRQKVVEQQIEVERIKTLKEAEVQLAEAQRQANELVAKVIKPAEAQRESAVTIADGERQAAIQRAEGEKQKLILEGEGRAAAALAQGKAQAEIIKLTGASEGEGKAAALLAEGRSQAEVVRLKLLAEAEGIAKKADAIRRLDEAGRTLQILEALRQIIPDALDHLAPVMGEIAKPLGNVDRISLVDFGSGNSGGSLGRFVQAVPLVLTQFFESLKALGLDSDQIEKLLKVKAGPPAPPEGDAKTDA